MEEVTLGEIARKLDRHIEDTKLNNKNQNEMLQLLVVQSTTTKGEIDGIKKDITGHEITLKEHETEIDGLKGSKKYFLGALGVLSFIGWFVYNSVTDNLKNDLRQDITKDLESLLDERVSGVYLER